MLSFIYDLPNAYPKPDAKSHVWGSPSPDIIISKETSQVLLWLYIVAKENLSSTVYVVSE